MDDLSMPSARARPREPVCKSTSWRAFRVPLGRGSEQPRSAPSPRTSRSDPRSSSRPGDPDAAPICPSRRQEPVLKSPSSRVRESPSAGRHQTPPPDGYHWPFIYAGIRIEVGSGLIKLSGVEKMILHNAYGYICVYARVFSEKPPLRFSLTAVHSRVGF